MDNTGMGGVNGHFSIIDIIKKIKEDVIMKLYKLSQGSTFENLKHFMYITNEYGVPSAEFIDGFIENFGEDILSGTFSFTDDQYDELDNLWEEIVADCKQHGTESSLNYGSLFYRIVGTKAVEFIKKNCEEKDFDKEDNENKLKLLKGFIENMDKYIE